jgi:thiol-disulfide isomerase/thioredoxin
MVNVSRQMRSSGLLFLLLSLVCIQGCQNPSDSASGSATGAELRSFPEFEFGLLDVEKKKTLGDYRGKVILINFWATWCAPCVAELPSLQKLHERLSGKDFAVVAINVDSADALARVRELRDSMGLTFEILLDPDISLAPKLGVTGFPETFFIDREGRQRQILDPDQGKLVDKIISDRDWNSAEMFAAVEALVTR